MAFMAVLLEKYANRFCWFSLRAAAAASDNHFGVPYAYADHLRQPTRLRLLKQYLNLGPWAGYMGYKASRFGRAQNVEVVLADLAFEAVVAGRVAARLLNVPLLVSVHDDPVNRIRVKGAAPWLLKLYDHAVFKTMKAAARCGVICNAMGQVYQDRYGVATTTLFIGVEEHKCLSQRHCDARKAPIVVGSVGSVNYLENWRLLLDAVRLLNRK